MTGTEILEIRLAKQSYFLHSCLLQLDDVTKVSECRREQRTGGESAGRAVWCNLQQIILVISLLSAGNVGVEHAAALFGDYTSIHSSPSILMTLMISCYQVKICPMYDILPDCESSGIFFFFVPPGVTNRSVHLTNVFSHYCLPQCHFRLI